MVDPKNRSVLGRRVTQKEYDRLTSADKAHDKSKSLGHHRVASQIARDSIPGAPSRASQVKVGVPSPGSRTNVPVGQPPIVPSAPVASPVPEELGLGGKLSEGIQKVSDFGLPAGWSSADGVTYDSSGRPVSMGVPPMIGRAGSGIKNLLRIGKSVKGGYHWTQKAASVAKAGAPAINPKTVALADKILKMSFAQKVLAFGGAWAGATFFGLWGQAESPEGITFVANTNVLDYAVESGDWDSFHEAMAYADELSDLKKWEQIMLMTPLGPAVGVVNKIKGARYATKLLRQVGKDMQIHMENSETWEESHARIREEDRANELRWRAEDDAIYEAKKEANYLRDLATREDNSAYYLKEELARAERSRQRDVDKAKFWSDYWAEVERLKTTASSSSSSTYEPPSSLGFGLL